MQRTFQPTHYYNTFGPHEPAFCVEDGDTVLTTTLDARGGDAARQQRGERGNPLTGPIAVRGAEPGDALQVAIEMVRPNRAYGFCGNAVAAHVVDASYVPQLPAAALAEWEVDADRHTATLVSPQTRLTDVTLPLEPMLGCIGVAPPQHQAIASSTSGPYGGNMDYRGLGAGTTLYLPVYEPDALLFVGDGHAIQGDGEIVGMGIEISMDVRLTVQVLKGKKIGWPRGENTDYIFTMGNARPLDQAVQHATTEMLRWLQDDYGFDAQGASILLGQCVQYDLGNVFDPAYTMVCKVAKRLLALR